MNPDILIQPEIGAVIKWTSQYLNSLLIARDGGVVVRLSIIFREVVAPTKNSDKVDKHLFPGIIGLIDNCVDEGLSTLSGFLVTPHLHAMPEKPALNEMFPYTP